MMGRLLAYLGSQSPRALLLGMAGLLLLLLAQGWLLLRQPVGEYLKARHESTALQAYAKAPRQAPEEIARTERTLVELKQRLAAADSPVPPGGLIAQVVDRLAAIAQRHGATLQAVKPAASRHVRGFDETAFDVEVTGTYRSLAACLDQAERDLSPMVITQFSIKRGSAADEALSLRLRLAAYQLPPSGAPAK